MARSEKVLSQARADYASLGPEDFVTRYRALGWSNGEMAGVMARGGIKAGELHRALNPPPEGRFARPAMIGAMRQDVYAAPQAQEQQEAGERERWAAEQARRQAAPLLRTEGYGLDPELQRRLQEFARLLDDRGFRVRITEGYRPPQQQDRDYAQGRTRPGRIITYARAGQSPHQYHIAADVCWDMPGRELYDGRDWEVIGECADAAHLQWGGHWQGRKQDRPHLEMPDWQSYVRGRAPGPQP